MEVGGYRELDLRKGYEYYNGSRGIARLNAGRCGIFHAVRILGCSKVLMPYYQCSTVRDFLNKKEVEISYYHIDENFLPIINNQDDSIAFLVVNYFGLIKQKQMEEVVRNSKNVIIDNTQGFFQKPMDGSISVYSPRKFFGVPDGCYVIGENADMYVDEYENDSSSESSLFLLSRIESGGNKNHKNYIKNEERINRSDILQMSVLTRRLLDNVDYSIIKSTRDENYRYANSRFAGINRIDTTLLQKEDTAIPMVYPLIIENEEIRVYLKNSNIFVGQWWKYIIDWDEASDWEKYLSRYMLPIQIDQRYGRREIDYQYEVINSSICK